MSTVAKFTGDIATFVESCNNPTGLEIPTAKAQIPNVWWEDKYLLSKINLDVGSPFDLKNMANSLVRLNDPSYMATFANVVARHALEFKFKDGQRAGYLDNNGEGYDWYQKADYNEAATSISVFFGKIPDAEKARFYHFMCLVLMVAVIKPVEHVKTLNDKMGRLHAQLIGPLHASVPLIFQDNACLNFFSMAMKDKKEYTTRCLCRLIYGMEAQKKNVENYSLMRGAFGNMVLYGSMPLVGVAMRASAISKVKSIDILKTCWGDSLWNDGMTNLLKVLFVYTYNGADRNVVLGKLGVEDPPPEGQAFWPYARVVDQNLMSITSNNANAGALQFYMRFHDAYSPSVKLVDVYKHIPPLSSWEDIDLVIESFRKLTSVLHGDTPAGPAITMARKAYNKKEGEEVPKKPEEKLLMAVVPPPPRVISEKPAVKSVKRVVVGGVQDKAMKPMEPAEEKSNAMEEVEVAPVVHHVAPPGGQPGAGTGFRNEGDLDV